MMRTTVERRPLRDDLKWAWIAGVVEGEGTLTVERYRKDGTPVPKLAVAMVDADTIERLYHYSNMGTLASHTPANEEHQHVYTWRVRRLDDVHLAVRRMWPYLGSRRRARCQDLMIDPNSARLIR